MFELIIVSKKRRRNICTDNFYKYDWRFVIDDQVVDFGFACILMSWFRKKQTEYSWYDDDFDWRHRRLATTTAAAAVVAPTAWSGPGARRIPSDFGVVDITANCPHQQLENSITVHDIQCQELNARNIFCRPMKGGATTILPSFPVDAHEIVSHILPKFELQTN